MCRVAVRQGTQPRAEEAASLDFDDAFADTDLLDAAPLSFDDLFSGEGALDGLDAGDLDLVAQMFSATAQPELPAASVEASAAGPTSTAEGTAVLGQPAYSRGVSVEAPAAPLDPVAQLQLQALLQQQSAAGVLLPQPSYASLPVVGQPLLFQPGYAPVVGAATAPEPPVAKPPVALLAPGAKRNKTPSEIEDQIERTKKRRRESAQRSRQRKNCYMRALEVENEALKLEVSRLRAELSKSHLPVAGSGNAASDSSSKPALQTTELRPPVKADAAGFVTGTPMGDSMFACYAL